MHYINLHVGIDEQMIGKTSIEMLKDVLNAVSIPIAVAGGLNAETAAQAVKFGANIVIVGGNIIHSSDVKEPPLKYEEQLIILLSCMRRDEVLMRR